MSIFFVYSRAIVCQQFGFKPDKKLYKDSMNICKFKFFFTYKIEFKTPVGKKASSTLVSSNLQIEVCKSFFFSLYFGALAIHQLMIICNCKRQQRTAKKLRLKSEAKFFFDVVSSNGSIWRNANKTRIS